MADKTESNGVVLYFQADRELAERVARTVERLKAAGIAHPPLEEHLQHSLMAYVEGLFRLDGGIEESVPVVSVDGIGTLLVADAVKPKADVGEARERQRDIEKDILEGVAHNTIGGIDSALDFISQNSAGLDELVRIQAELEQGDTFVREPRVVYVTVPLNSPLRRIRDLLSRWDRSDQQAGHQWREFKKRLRHAEPPGVDRAPCTCCSQRPQESGFAHNELVESWRLDVDDDGITGTQVLLGMRFVCPSCATLLHIEREFTGHKQRQVIEHVCRVNDLSLIQARRFLQSMKDKQQKMSQLTWKVDLRVLKGEQYGLRELGLLEVPDFVESQTKEGAV